MWNSGFFKVVPSSVVTVAASLMLLQSHLIVQHPEALSGLGKVVTGAGNNGDFQTQWFFFFLAISVKVYRHITLGFVLGFFMQKFS